MAFFGNNDLPSKPLEIQLAVNRAFGMRHTLTEKGQVTRLYKYHRAGNPNRLLKLGIYSHNAGANKPLNLLVETGGISTNPAGSWAWFSGAVNIVLSPDTYHLAWNCNDGAYKSRCRVAAVGHQENSAYPTLPNPWTANWALARDCAIYAEYTPMKGGSSSVVPLMEGIGMLQTKRKSILKPFTSRMPKFSPKIVV